MVVKYNSIVSIFIVVMVSIYIIPRGLEELSPLIWSGILVQILVAAFFYKRPYFEISESKVLILGLIRGITYGDEAGASILIEGDCIYVKKTDGSKKKIPIFHFASDKDDWGKMKQMFSPK